MKVLTDRLCAKLDEICTVYNVRPIGLIEDTDCFYFQIDAYVPAEVSPIDEIEKAREENARLRELSSEMLKAMKHIEDTACTGVSVAYSGWFQSKLRGMGIEVESDG